jgi:hypothetical protein
MIWRSINWRYRSAVFGDKESAVTASIQDRM